MKNREHGRVALIRFGDAGTAKKKRTGIQTMVNSFLNTAHTVDHTT